MKTLDKLHQALDTPKKLEGLVIISLGISVLALFLVVGLAAIKGASRGN